MMALVPEREKRIVDLLMISLLFVVIPLVDFGEGVHPKLAECAARTMNSSRDNLAATLESDEDGLASQSKQTANKILNETMNNTEEHFNHLKDLVIRHMLGSIEPCFRPLAYSRGRPVASPQCLEIGGLNLQKEINKHTSTWSRAITSMGDHHLNTLGLEIVNNASRLIEDALISSVRDIVKGVVSCTYGENVASLLRITYETTNE